MMLVSAHSRYTDSAIVLVLPLADDEGIRERPQGGGAYALDGVAAQQMDDPMRLIPVHAQKSFCGHFHGRIGGRVYASFSRRWRADEATYVQRVQGVLNELGAQLPAL